LIATIGVPATDLSASRRHMLRPAVRVGLLMRNWINLIVALVTLADFGSRALPVGEWLLAALGCWSLYRVATRSRHWLPLVIDYVFVLAVCVSIPALAPDPLFYASNSAPQAIAGTAVVSFAVSVPAAVSLPMTGGIAAAYAWGSAQILGWSHIGPVAALYYFALQWITAALLRFMLLRIAAAIDRTRAARAAAEFNRQVSDAVRQYEREQLALLHDTAASTLLIVGQGGHLAPQRLAAQARRDLQLLDESSWEAPPTSQELVDALRNCASHMTTPARFDGRDRLWLGGEAARAVIAAARETMNNVDRHAEATEVTINVTDHSVVLTDNGIGFDPASPRIGHGVTDSILGRMQRAGGTAVITSAPGRGTTTELRWPKPSFDTATDLPSDPDRLIERLRVRYGLALVVYALANLAFTVPHSVITAGHGVLNAALALAAAACTLAAIPGIRSSRTHLVWPAGVVLMAIVILQRLLLEPTMVGGTADWAQGAIGWCALPLLLGFSTRMGVWILIAYWSIGAAVEFICNPTSATLVNIGLGSASILGVQLFALAFNGLMRESATAAQAEVHAHKRIALRDLVERALRAEYQRRYAQLVDNVVPLLRALSDGAAVDDHLRARARAQSRRMRALFDQAATFEHPFMQAVRPLVDAAEARQVGVTVDLAGDLSDLPPAEIDALLRPVAEVMARTTESARIVVSCSAQDFSVSIVCHGLSLPIELSEDPRVDIDIIEADDTVWLLVSHIASCQGVHSHVLAG
jgi:hypothetical protein